MSWRIKLPLLLVVFATAPLTVTAWWTFDLIEKTYETSTTESLQALARARSEAIEQFTEDRRNEVERIAKLLAPEVQELTLAKETLETLRDAPQEPLPELKDAEEMSAADEAGTKDDEAPATQEEPGEEQTAQEEKDPEPRLNAPSRKVEEALKVLRQKLGLILWDQQKFEELLLIAADGDVLVSTFAEHEGRTATEVAYFESGLGTTYVQPVFLSPITGRLTMVIATPIRNEDAEVMGVLAARLNLSRFFRLINDTTGLKKTGETVVGKRVDDAIVMMAPTRLDSEAALEREVPIGSERSLALQRAARGESGTGRVVDYRGQCTYAAWEHVPSLQWALAVKMDCAEAIAPVRKIRQRTLIWSIALGAFALLAALLVAQALVKPLNQLRTATDRLSKGDFDVRLNINQRDEVGELAESFERMVAAIKFFREQSKTDEEAEEYDEEEPPSREPRSRTPPSRKREDESNE